MTSDGVEAWSVYIRVVDYNMNIKITISIFEYLYTTYWIIEYALYALVTSDDAYNAYVCV
jgi:hypothetical protein